jgi:poly(3-hydroxyalkanoate) synthetase
MTPNDLINDLKNTSEKLSKGFNVLQTIDKVEVGTTPKTLVWHSDKVKLYHYDRETPAKCKIPVLVSFAIMNRHDVLDLQPRPVIDEQVASRRVRYLYYGLGISNQARSLLNHGRLHTWLYE